MAADWSWCPSARRLARGLARDGQDQREHWVRWMRDEQRLFAEQDTRAHADLVVDTGLD